MISPASQTVFITGASAGIGRATAIRLAREGVSLALAGRSPEKLAATVASIRLENPEARIFSRAFDITDDAVVSAFVRDAVAAVGAPGALVHSAGGNPVRGTVGAATPAEWDAQFALNCRATASVVRACWPHWTASRDARCVVVVSSMALFSAEGNGPYAASKAAQKSLCDTLRKEGRSHGVGVCAVYPGGVDTDFRPQSRPEYMRAESVAEAIVSALKLPGDAMMHEMTLRPPCEANFV